MAVVRSAEFGGEQFDDMFERLYLSLLTANPGREITLIDESDVHSLDPAQFVLVQIGFKNIGGDQFRRIFVASGEIDPYVISASDQCVVVANFSTQI